MANNFDSNITRKLMRVFLDAFDTARVLTKNVDTQLLSGVFNPSTGDTVDFKRPTDYTSERDPTGDLTGKTAKDIVTGKASGIVQDYFTVLVDYDERDESLSMDQLSELLTPAATRIVTDLELDYGQFMLRNSALLAGTPGTAVGSWDDVSEAGAVMKSRGVPMDNTWTYAIGPFTQRVLASDQRSLGAGGSAGGIIKSAHEKAMLTQNFGGLMVMTSTALGSFAIPTVADPVGIVASNPDVTYPTTKDTMTQSIAVSGFGTSNATIPAGTIVRITGRNQLNLSTRKIILDATGSPIEYTGVLTAAATLTSGAGTFIVTGPAIFEVATAGAGSYNTVDSAVVQNDIITILGPGATHQPNLFWHKQAFSLGTVPIRKLHATDTVGTTEDGIQLRVTRFSDGIKNSQQVRFDLHPAYAALNQHLAGQGWGQ